MGTGRNGNRKNWVYILPNIHFPQVPVCAKSPFTSVPIRPCAHLPQSPYAQVPICPCFDLHRVPIRSGTRMLQCPFFPNAHLLYVSIYSKFPISPKCSFALVPICHSAHNFPICPFALVPISPKCLLPKVLIYSGAHFPQMRISPKWLFARNYTVTVPGE